MLTALLALALAGVPQDSTHLVVVATAGVRGQAMAWDYLTDTPAPSGVARIASIVDSLRARYPGEVLVADAGDALYGSPFGTFAGYTAPRDPHPVIEAFNLVGYDVGTPAFGDLAAGLLPMRRAFSGAAFPYVSANLLAVSDETALYRPYVVIRRAGLRIAVAGFAVADVPNSDVLGAAEVRMRPPDERAAAVFEAAGRDADVIIALGHGGAKQDPARSGAGGPDLVIGRETVLGVRNAIVDGVPIAGLRPGAGEVAVTHLWLVRNRRTWRVQHATLEIVTAAAAPPAARIMTRLARDHAAARVWAQAPLGFASTAFAGTAFQVGASPLAEFVNRVQRGRTGAMLSVTSLANVRTGFEQGEVRRAHLLALYPGDRTLVAVKISGAQLRAYLEHAARYFRVDAVGRVSFEERADGFDVLGGATYDINLRAPPGARIDNLAIQGRPVQPADSVTLALTDARRRGAGGYTMLAGAPLVYDRHEDVRDVLADEIARRRTIDPAEFTVPSWTVVPAAMASAVRARAGLSDTAPQPASPRERIVLRILAPGDLRGRFETGPRLATLLDSLAHECSCGTLRLGGGDVQPAGGVAQTIVGDAPTVMVERLGLAAAVLGERELDADPTAIARHVTASAYPWLVANIFDSTTGRRPSWAIPFRIVTAGGLRVAVIGYITADARRLLGHSRAAGLYVAEGMLSLKTVLDDVRAEKPDFTVLLAHAGPTELDSLVRSLPRGSLDAIIAAHGAGAIPAEIFGVPALGTAAEGTAIAIADIVQTVTGGREVRASVVRVTAGAASDTALAALAERLRRRADSVAAATVATLKFPFGRNDARLGQLVAAARRNQLRVDLSVVRTRDLQADLPAGAVTLQHLLAVQPAGRRLMAVRLTGAAVLQLFEEMLRDGPPTAAIDGMEVRYDAKRTPGQRVHQVRLPDGGVLHRSAEYWVATDEATIQASTVLSHADRTAVVLSAMRDVDALAAYLPHLAQPVELSGSLGFLSSHD